MDGVINAGHRNPMSTGNGITVESSIDPIRDALGNGSEVQVVRISTPTTPDPRLIASVAASRSKWCRTSSLSDPTIAHDETQRTSRYEPIAVQRVDRNHDVLVKKRLDEDAHQQVVADHGHSAHAGGVLVGQHGPAAGGNQPSQRILGMVGFDDDPVGIPARLLHPPQEASPACAPLISQRIGRTITGV